MGRIYAAPTAYRNRTRNLIRRKQMGRPLKIAKAQAVITITATTATTNIVTTSANLTSSGVIKGMTFIPATTVGGLTGGVTFYILEILTDTTFLASATDLSANATRTPVTLTTTTGQTVAATVGLVGSGFNNPTGTANTYGVVGGNTALFGDQILAGVAIGQAGTGTITTSASSTTVTGSGTDFSQLAVGSKIETTDGTLIGTVDSIGVTVTVTATVETGSLLLTSSTAGLVAGQPITFSADIGGLTAGTTYFVVVINTNVSFTVSLTAGGSLVAVEDETKTVTGTQSTVLALVANAAVAVTGANFVFATSEAGYILRQKGKTKYLVRGITSGLVSQCFTANVANAALTSNTMSIAGTTAASATVYVQNISDVNSQIFYDTSNATADPDFYATFNTAEVANVAAGIYKPVITINKG